MLAFFFFLPGGDSVTRVNKEGEGRSERFPPISRGKRVDLSGGVKVEQAVSKNARRLHLGGNEGGRRVVSLYRAPTSAKVNSIYQLHMH